MKAKQILNEVQKMHEKKLVDEVHSALSKVPDFKQLSMDQQGEISVAVVKLIK